MKTLNVYLGFAGNCEEALHFYASCLGGEIEFLQRYGDSPLEVPDEHKQRIMHARLRAGQFFFMASDSMPGQPVQPGNTVQLSLDLDNAAEQTAIFNKLSDGGKVTMPLEDTFWGAHFGMLIDKYGIHWMLNRNLQPQ